MNMFLKCYLEKNQFNSTNISFVVWVETTIFFDTFYQSRLCNKYNRENMKIVDDTAVQDRIKLHHFKPLQQNNFKK